MPRTKPRRLGSIARSSISPRLSVEARRELCEAAGKDLSRQRKDCAALILAVEEVRSLYSTQVEAFDERPSGAAAAVVLEGIARSARQLRAALGRRSLDVKRRQVLAFSSGVDLDAMMMHAGTVASVAVAQAHRERTAESRGRPKRSAIRITIVDLQRVFDDFAEEKTDDRLFEFLDAALESITHSADKAKLLAMIPKKVQTPR